MQQVMGSVMANFSEQIAAELQAQLGAAMEQAMGQISTNLQSQMTERFSSLGSQMESALKIDADAFRDAIRFNMTEDDLAELMKSKMMSTKSPPMKATCRPLVMPARTTPARSASIRWTSSRRLRSSTCWTATMPPCVSRARKTR